MRKERESVNQNQSDSFDGYSNIVIKTKGSKTFIEIDGHELKGVRAYELKHAAGGIPVLTLDINAIDTTIDSDFVKYRNIDGMELEVKYGKERC